MTLSFSVPRIALTGLWLGAVAGGFAVLGRFEATPGAAASAHERWPDGAPLERNHAGPTLLVFAHPRCPCTAATIEALNRLLAHSVRVRTTVLFYSDRSLGDDWLESPSYSAALGIPGVDVVADELGAAARLFGARTSGQVLLYDSAGRLRFAGGITPARGQAGDSGGTSALRALLNGGDGASRAPVFGCSLLGPAGAAP